MRSGKYVQQLSGYKAFIPAPLPPHPPLHIDEEMAKNLSQANLLLLHTRKPSCFSTWMNGAIKCKSD